MNASKESNKITNIVNKPNFNTKCFFTEASLSKVQFGTFHDLLKPMTLELSNIFPPIETSYCCSSTCCAYTFWALTSKQNSKQIEI